MTHATDLEHIGDDLLIVEEARSRHEEIQLYVKHGHQIILWTIAAHGAYWMWFFKSVVNGNSELTNAQYINYLAWIPFALVILLFSRWFACEYFISLNAKFLRNRIEKEYPNNIVGWERYLYKKSRHKSNALCNQLQVVNWVTSYLIWFGLFVVDVVGVYQFTR